MGAGPQINALRYIVRNAMSSSQESYSKKGARPWSATASVAAALTAALALRIWAFVRLFEVNGDSLIYGSLARHMLEAGRYALTANGITYGTLIRLPGYPLYLAACFRIFGMENYAPACWVALALELAGCLLLASAARQLAPATLGPTAFHATLWLAALCPFTAAYTAFPLTETPTLFSIALALWAAARLRNRPGWLSSLAFTFGITWAAMLRPDGALVMVALAPAVAFRAWGGLRLRPVEPRLARMLLVCALLAATPFAVWTARNWRVFHVIEPLAPKSASDPGEPLFPGWDHWVKTWSLDFVSTYQIYWNVPGDHFDTSMLPERAFDSPGERDRVEAIASRYNQTQRLSRAVDDDFEQLARERDRAHPLRSFVLLPLGRAADMWLRPRIENLPIDLDWWNYGRHRAETRFTWAWIGLNLLYLSLAALGFLLKPRMRWAIAAYFLLRSMLLATLEAPEARYTLECFPMVLMLAGIAVAWMWKRAATARVKA